ncbi:hypothetical protein EV386_0649 [Xylanimonas ulmi]|uniref:Uncharacterized protein n=2 Tax=Xylanimonas ulmi TaxID=228973 RepID=A0A4Q7LZI5_9MICO|nr:hypothetical protein EV386_0649 [Xylanibacterium ulmi]
MIAVAMIVVGVILTALGVWLGWRWHHSAAFGWFAYAPLSDQAFTISWPAPWLTLSVTALGALLVGSGAGYLLGARPRRPDRSGEAPADPDAG